MDSGIISRNRVILIALVGAVCLIMLYIAYVPQDASAPHQSEVAESPHEPGAPEVVSGTESIVPSHVTATEKTHTEAPSSTDKTTVAGLDESDPLVSEVYLQAHEATDKALFDRKYSDPAEFVKLRWFSGMNCKEARRLIGKDKLPVLHQMLEDPNYAPYWHDVARLIGFVSEDPNSVPVLLRYFERDDSWNWKMKESLGHVRLRGKIDALQWIGKIGGADAESLLQKAVTKTGAAQVAKAWIGDALIPTSSTFGTEENTIVFLRGRAAMGLVFTRKPDNVDVVNRLLAKELAYCAANKTFTRLYNPLASAMAYNDFIVDNNRESLFNLFGSQERRNALRPYIRKYAWQKYVQDRN